MAKKLSSVLGIDIGSHNIKICEIKASGNGATVTAVGVAPTPEGAADYSGVYNAEAIGDTIKKLAAQTGVSSQHAIVSVAGQHSVLVRVLEVPRVADEKELASQMEWEINKNIPFSETTIQSDYKEMPSADPTSAQMEVVMGMAPQTAVDTLLDVMKKAGKKPYAIDVQPLGLARSLAVSDDAAASGQGVCVVDVGHSTTSINIYEGRNLVLPRPVPGGSELITRGLADGLQLGMDEAKAYKENNFSIPATASANTFVGFDSYSDNAYTQSFAPDTTYVAAGPGDAYDPNVTMASAEPIMDAATDLAPDNNALQFDPVTGDPIAPAVDAAQGVLDDVVGVGADAIQSGGEAAAAAISSFNPFGDPSEGTSDAPAPAADVPGAFAPESTGQFDPNWGATTSMPAVAGGSDAAFDAVSGVLSEFVAEIQRSVDYYRGKGGTLSRIVLCGGGAKLKGLAGYIERSTGVSCRLYDPMNNLTLAPKKVGMDYLNEYRQELAVAVGNGLHIVF